VGKGRKRQIEEEETKGKELRGRESSRGNDR